MEQLLHLVGLCPDSNSHFNILLISANEIGNLLLTLKLYVWKRI